MLKKFFLLFFLLSLFAVVLSAQETIEEAELSAEEIQADIELTDETEDNLLAEETEPEEELDPQVIAERRRIEQEIRISTLSELAIWARTLGLSESGTREDLSNRIREYFNLTAPLAENEEQEGQRIIIIESAQTTEYFTIESVNEDYARLKGDVELMLQEGDAIHRIKAQEIIFNRTRNILTAKGGVEYIKEDGDTTEIFRGENITVNIDNWSSIFLDGDSEKKLEGEGTSFRFEGSVITRSDEDVMILNKARMSNANNPEALWSINATRIWLLPGSDFAIFNGVLKVGEIPVLYIPFFYYPVDEIIFRPVIGYRSREGGFVQTTTYLIGRPKVNPEEQSSLARILGNSEDMEKERHGIFLKSTGRKIQDPTEFSLKALVDYYVNLGYYLGLDLSTPQAGILNPIDLSLGAGFTRTLTLLDGNYTPYAPEFDGTFDWNYSNLFSRTVPFRYRFHTQSSLGGRYGSLSWNLPFYSDPYVDMDFLNRSEHMDWLNMVQQGAAYDDTTVSENEIGAYQWQLSGRLNPSLPFLAPYVSNISLTNISLTLAFKTIRNEEIFSYNEENPGRFFYAPDRFTIYSVSASISGTPLTIGGDQTSSATNNTPDEEREDPFRGIGVPRSPWPQDETSDSVSNAIEDKLVPPVLTQRFDLPRFGNNRFIIDYQLMPTSSAELQFRSGFDYWKTQEDVDWSEIQSILSTFSGNGNVNFRINHSENLYTNTITFSASGNWRDFNFINEEAEAYKTPQNPDGEPDEKRIEDARRQQWSQTNYSSSYAYTGIIRPLFRNDIFGQSNFEYTFRGTLVRSKRYTDREGPELSPRWGAWVKEETKDGEEILGLNEHKFSTNFAANVMNYMQNISVGYVLPPLDPLISTNATFRVWISETNARIDFRKPEIVDNEPNEEWIIDPFHLTETLRFTNNHIATYYMVLDPEEDNEITTITSTLTLWDFRASFSAVKSVKWEWKENPEGGGSWVQTEDEPALRPRELSFTYNRNFLNKEIIPNRLNFSVNVNSRLFYDLQRYTNSNFQFTSGFTLGINNFLDLSLSATSENTVIFRYFKNFPGMEERTSMYIEGPQNNVFIDLANSFNFWDDMKRRRTGFKMKSFNLNAVHHLGDWTATFGVSMFPYLDTDTEPGVMPRYKVNADVSFLLQWKVITEIKSDIRYERRTDRFIIE